MSTLSALPNEILSLITSHLDRPCDVLNLSLANQTLNGFVELDGWKAYLKGRFRLGGLDTDARRAVHGITTLYRNWDRKGLVAKYLEPTLHTKSLNTWESSPWRGPRGQTMGYQPSLDSYEETFGAWKERREVLAWSAGTQIVMRIKETGSGIDQIWEDEQNVESQPDKTWAFDAFKHMNSWFTYRIPESFEGRDDITSLKLLRPHQRDSNFEDVVFGTASGQLSFLSVSPERSETLEQRFETNRRAVGSISISSSIRPLVAATLGDSSLAVYPINSHDLSEDTVDPLTEVRPVVGAQNSRIWSCNFISNSKVALGLGPSSEPIHVYEITPEGFLSEPIRTFNLESKSRDSRVDVQRSTSIYPIQPIPNNSQGGSEAGNVFLSGGYDGIIRLHDMRSPRGFDTLFWDPTNDSSIYSLAIQGLERVVAGVSMHSMVKVFDLRFSGSHAYHTVSLPSKPKKTQGQDFACNAIVDETRDTALAVSGGWNLYLNPRVPPKRNVYREEYWRGRENSPVYSLSIPSPTSTNIYAGLEGSVQSLTFHSVADAHPDTLFSQTTMRSTNNGAIDARTAYNPHGDGLSLGMYEQGNAEGLDMQLLVQDDIAAGAVNKKDSRDVVRSRGLDERWRDPRDDGDRWVRGATPQGPRRGGRHGRGGGRGGRGRGRAHT
ncbi:hypothetical protein P153DRAFT_288956 [Dothidotthia symphoricarpi CBS 119687]|uniref:F-box domain-containing protein n=1 Tax=Dothidotthia symphoricarpi CBS 119687 TaxID=1392245 RepID=A0A6A6AGX1_9PLEO|nr:uncharacterized protein P153DRAFT_288956 [Dothidotthia symphoricarpi CBS 119687]KAF2130308.1 hypothetical protein P153DRAFT_288956 [Dothidotthia symphoricarpi CBS 119687]